MKKIFVLDTNVLIHNPEAIFSFEGNDVFLPIFVIEEIDKLKKKPNTGVQARIASRLIDSFREKGCLNKGVHLDGDIFFKIATDVGEVKLPKGLAHTVIDNKILSFALALKDNKEQRPVILVSKDINMRIKADSLGITVQDFESDRVAFNALYEGIYNVDISTEDLNKFKEQGRLKLEDTTCYPNSFIILSDGKSEGYGRYNYDNKRVERLLLGDTSTWGIRARNTEQRFAMEVLLDPSVKVISLVGKAGTGKTLLAVAAGLEEVVERGNYKKLLIARPIVSLGNELGFLPGNEKDKLKPWMQPIYDNIEFLSESKDDKSGEKVVAGLESLGLLKIEALSYIRGRSIPSGFIIIDEAQNLTPLEVKTIVTRAGENTKIIFTGDPEQVDSPYLDANSNGLSYLAEKLKEEKISGHITLKKGERSELAEIAAKLL